MKKFVSGLIFLIIFQSCVTSKSALKNFNNAEFNSAAEKYEQIVKTNDPILYKISDSEFYAKHKRLPTENDVEWVEENQ